MISMGKHTNSLGLPQANSSLFGPVALIYLSRHHRKSDSYGRCAWLEWKSGACAWCSSKYEHNRVVMNLPLCPLTADDVNSVVAW